MPWLATAVERAMKRQEVILRAALAPQGWPQARSSAGPRAPGGRRRSRRQHMRPYAAAPLVAGKFGDQPGSV